VELFFLFNSTIKVLSMNRCQVDDFIIESLGKGLLKNYTFEELYLSQNLITVRIAISFIYRVLD
jgi:hypothetical protein